MANKESPHSPLYITADPNVFDAFHWKLYELQQSGTLTDFTLRCADGSISCHKVVLMASSIYFRSMMRSNMQETVQNETTLSYINSITLLEALVQYFYLGHITMPLEYSDVKCLTQVADFLQLIKLKEKCQNFLIKELCYKNCISSYKFGSTFGLQNLVKRAKKIMAKKFNRVTESEEFLALSFDEVVDYITDDEIEISRVTCLLEACKDWVKFDIDSRQKYLKDLVCCIKLKHVQAGAISYFIEENKDIINYETEICIYQTMFNTKQTSTGSLVSKNSIVLIGGRKPNGVKNSHMQVYDDGDLSWQDLPDIPPAADHIYSSICQVEDGLFITGGRPGVNTGGSKVCHIYITRYNVWLKLPNMKTEHSYHGSVSFNSIAYVFGGRQENSKSGDSVEAFDLIDKKWSFVSPMLQRIGICPIHCIFKSTLYVLCNTCPANEGIKKEHGLKLQIYNMVKDKWTVGKMLPQTVRETCGSSMVSYKDDLYLVGGSLKLCSRYSVTTETWTNIRTPLQIQNYAAAVVYNHRILLLGGATDTPLKSPTHDILEYNPNQDQWTVSQHKCAVNVFGAFAFVMEKGHEFLED